jgi:hypothetical protein
MARAGVIGLCLVLSLVLVTGTGCMKCGQEVSEKMVEQAVEKATGGKADIDVGSSVDLSGLPEFLHYAGATAKASWSMSGKDGSGTVYSFETKDPAASVIDFYKKALAGWKNSSTMQNEKATVMVYGKEDEKEFATVTVSREKDENTTSLTVMYTKKD